MRIEVACGAAELGCHRTSLEHLYLLVQTVYEHHDFLAQTCWRSRLSVCLGEHRHVFPLLGIGLELVNELSELRHVHVVERLLYRERHGRVVDVLRSQAEMYELLVFFKITDLVNLFLYIILHGLHVVVRHLFYLLHPCGSLFRELAVDVAQCVEVGVVEVCELRQWQFAQCDEILYLHTYAVSDERIL